MVSDPRGVGPASDRSWWLMQNPRTKRKKRSQDQEPASDTDREQDEQERADDPATDQGHDDRPIGRVIDLEA